MGKKRLVEYDPSSGITQYCQYDEAEDTTYLIEEYDDLAPTLDLCRKLANDEDYTRQGMKAGFWHFAFIPNMLIHKWRIEEGIRFFDRDHQAAVARKLFSPEYAYLRTSRKRHFWKE